MNSGLGTDLEWIGYPDIIRNYPYISKYGRNTYKKCFEHCKKLITSYDLEKIINDFNGVPMCAAVYKIEDSDGSIGYASYCFSAIEKAHDYARKCIKEHLIYCLSFYEGPYKYGIKNYRPQELIVSDEFKEIFEKRRLIDNKPISDIKDIFPFIKYCLVNINDNPHPNVEEFEESGFLEPNYGAYYLSKLVFNNAQKGDYENYDYFSYSDGKVK